MAVEGLEKASEDFYGHAVVIGLSYKSIPDEWLSLTRPTASR